MSVARFSEQWLADRLGKGKAEQWSGVVKVAAKPKAKPAVKVDGWLGFEKLLRDAGLPAPCYEFRFHAERGWRFDMAWPQHRIAVEVDGGIDSRGAHAIPANIKRDMEKGNAAQVAGWKFLRYTPANLARAVDDLQTILGVADGTAINSAA